MPGVEMNFASTGRNEEPHNERVVWSISGSDCMVRPFERRRRLDENRSFVGNVAVHD